MPPVAEMIVGVFPGQGAYLPGVLDGLVTSERTRAVVDEVEDVAVRMLGRGPSGLLGAGDRAPTADQLLATAPDTLQLAAFTTSVVLHEALRERGATWQLFVGHSLGEISALVAAGAFSLTEGTEVMCHRILALAEHDGSGGRMVALACDRTRTEQILALLPEAGVVVAAVNGNRQTTVSGPQPALTTVCSIAEALGVRASPLVSPHPFHNPVLQPARRAFARRIRDYRTGHLHTPVFSPILGRHYRSGEPVGDVLAAHLVHPVDLLGTVEQVHRAGGRIWVEMGAGRTVTNLVRSVNDNVLTLAPLAGPTSSVAEVAGFLAPSTDVPPVTPPAPVDSGAGPAPAEPIVAPAAHAEPIVAGPVGSVGSLDRAEVVAAVRALYARVLEYPEEVFEDDAQLEADLGVDSVKQTELFGRVAQLYGVVPPTNGFRIGDHPTFGSVVDLVLGHASTAGEQVATPTVPPTAVAEPAVAEPAVAGPVGSVGSLDRAEVVAAVRALYARVLEYPEEVFEDDAQLEADLGVDSVKQTELFGRVAQLYGVVPPTNGFRIGDHPTFGSVVDLVVSGSAGTAVAVR
ncbi:acyltransferase domain-containing protein [Micromonospora wenchangensis]